MTDNLQDIDGVGPSREEDLNEAGYETFADLAQADPEQLEGEISRLSEDKALDLVVQAQNKADLEDAGVETSEEGEVAIEDEDESETAESDSETVEAEDDAEDSGEEETAEETAESDSAETEADTVPFELSFDSPTEYDAFYFTVYDARQNLYRTNRGDKADVYDDLLDALRATDAEGTVTTELEAGELNDLHNELRTHIADAELQEEADALRQVEGRVNDIRQEYLF